MSDQRWERVQRIEQAYHERKDPEAIRAINLVYWRRILDAAREQGVTIGPSSRVLDIGCGGAGVLLAVEQGERTGVDPLMDFYLQKFPFLATTGVSWRQDTAEGFRSERPFDVVFSINMLDHTARPREAAANIASLLAPGGRLVFLLNVHHTRFWRAYFTLLYRFVDPPHPHHIHIDEVPGYFPGLELQSRRPADALWLDLEERYRREVIHHDSGQRPSPLRYLNVFKYPLAAERILRGRRVYRKKPDDECLMAGYLWVFRKPA